MNKVKFNPIEVSKLISLKDYNELSNLINKSVKLPENSFYYKLQNYLTKKINNEKIEGKKNGICLNTTSKEFDKIESLFKIWEISECLKYAKNIEFFICLDNLENKIIDKLKILIKNYNLEKYFLKVKIISVNIPEEINFYKREVDGTLDLDKFIYGYKSGPNYQFFRCMDILREEKLDHVYMLETDCYPLAPDWIPRLFNSVSKQQQFWVLGSPFVGQSKLDPAICLHINGAAVYSISSNGFLEMIQEWEEIVKMQVKSLPYIAYDWSFDCYYYELVSRQNWDKLSSNLIQKYIEFKRNFIYTKLIINLAGEQEREGKGRYKLEELFKKFSDAVIVHGDYYYDELLQFYKNEI